MKRLTVWKSILALRDHSRRSVVIKTSSTTAGLLRRRENRHGRISVNVKYIRAGCVDLPRRANVWSWGWEPRGRDAQSRIFIGGTLPHPQNVHLFRVPVERFHRHLQWHVRVPPEHSVCVSECRLIRQSSVSSVFSALQFYAFLVKVCHGDNLEECVKYMYMVQATRELLLQAGRSCQRASTFKAGGGLTMRIKVSEQPRSGWILSCCFSSNPQVARSDDQTWRR